MPDILDANGLQISTVTEVRQSLVQDFQDAYGPDINVDQNSPDGQIIGIFAQMAVDLRELLLEVYNSFDPDRAVGRQLDERVAINNIQRAGGTFTILDIDITVNQTVDLPGLDAAFNDVNGVGYTVQNNAGAKFILIDTATVTAGTHTLSFRAETIGQVEVVVNTVTNPTTIVIGVTGINNPSAPTSIGQNEETDAQLRQRRQRSVGLASTGYLNGLLGAVLALDGVTDAALYENVTDTTDGDGIPGHGIWLIAEGGSNTDIANQIYGRKTDGANMKGDVSVNITTASGAIFTAKFDRPEAVDLYIRFKIQRVGNNPSFTFSESSIKNYMVANLVYGIGDFAETSSVTAAALAGINAQGGNGVPVDAEVSSDGLAWVDYLATPTKDSKFTLDASRITITAILS